MENIKYDSNGFYLEFQGYRIDVTVLDKARTLRKMKERGDA